jgi:hypothetical protein
MNDLVPIAGNTLPVLIAAADENAQRRFFEFFAANIRNRNTRRAYGLAVREFLLWCEQHRLAVREFLLWCEQHRVSSIAHVGGSVRFKRHGRGVPEARRGPLRISRQATDLAQRRAGSIDDALLDKLR